MKNVWQHTIDDDEKKSWTIISDNCYAKKNK